jgi:hypothetical protein
MEFNNFKKITACLAALALFAHGISFAMDMQEEKPCKHHGYQLQSRLLQELDALCAGQDARLHQLERTVDNVQDKIGDIWNILKLTRIDDHDCEEKGPGSPFHGPMKPGKPTPEIPKQPRNMLEKAVDDLLKSDPELAQKTERVVLNRLSEHFFGIRLAE